MNTIGILLEAGLGNQLFMIFALVSYCIDNLLDYIIYYRQDEPKRTYWNTLLDAFADKAVIQTQEVSQVITYNEPHFHYKKLPNFDCQTNLKGYFQSPKYFAHNLERILQIMKFEEKMASIKHEYAALLQKPCIALHFRIGDYIGLQSYHPIQQPAYYVRALQHLIDKLKSMDKNINDYNILYFCQGSDNKIVEQYLQILKDATLSFAGLNTVVNFVKVPDNIDDWQQMLIMTSCEHFIIANSTFSWFPAYIADRMHKNKTIVCFPTHWFGILYPNNKIDDLIPDGWQGFDDRL